MPAVLLPLLGLVSTLDLRVRNPMLALQGELDWQIGVELALWGAAGAYVAWRLLHDRRWLVRRFPTALGDALQGYLLIVAVAVLSVLRLGSTLSLARGVQLAIAAGLAVVITRDAQTGATPLPTQWRWLRRTLVALVGAVVVATTLLPQLGGALVTYTGYERLRLFHTHPIGSGVILGIACVLIASAFLASDDPWLDRAVGRVAAAGGMAVLLLLLLETRARGPLLATAVSLGVLVALSPHRRRRAQAGLLALAGVGIAVGGAVDDLLYGAIVRGQTRSELFSLTGRTELFEFAGELFLDRPVLGYGYLAGRQIFFERFDWAGESHNAFVDLAVSLGLVGLVLYGVVLFRVMRSLRAARRLTDPWGRQVRVEGAALLAFLLTNGMIGAGFAGAVSLEVVVFVVLVALADDLARRRRTQAAPP